MKPETKSIFVREWMSLFGSFWAAGLLMLLVGAWMFHRNGTVPGEKTIVIAIVSAWLAIYLVRLGILTILVARRKS